MQSFSLPYCQDTIQVVYLSSITDTKDNDRHHTANNTRFTWRYDKTMLERMEKTRGSHPARAVFARNIRRIRRLREVSQESLAADAGLSRTYIGEVEREERAVSIDIMGQIADALGVPLKELVDPAMPISPEMVQR